MRVEKQCGYCNRFFYHEDGRINDTDTSTKIQAWCPDCVDPNAVTGMTYEKSTLLRIISTELDEEDVINLLPDYPGIEKLYYSTKYRTVTLYEGTEFDNFVIGELFTTGTGKFKIDKRRVYCKRCGKGANIEKYTVLRYYVGVEKRICPKCDSKLIKRNLNGIAALWGTHREGGRKKDPNSLREKCKQLNVSLSDYRKGIREWPPVLDKGTIVNGLRIVNAYYDDSHNVYSPKYLVECVKCQTKTVVVQKWIQTYSCLQCEAVSPNQK